MFQYDDDTGGPSGFAYDSGDYGGDGAPPDPPVITSTARNLTLQELLRGVT